MPTWVILAVLWKDYLIEHKELLVAVFASLVLNELVLVMVHQADPLSERITEDAALKAILMKSLVKLLVSELFHNMCMFVYTI